LASEREPVIREITCQKCGTVNSVKIERYASTKTIFCKKCGEKIQLIYNRTLVGLELKRSKREV